MGLGEKRRTESGEALTVLTDRLTLVNAWANGCVHFSAALMEVTKTCG